MATVKGYNIYYFMNTRVTARSGHTTNDLRLVQSSDIYFESLKHISSVFLFKSLHSPSNVSEMNRCKHANLQRLCFVNRAKNSFSQKPPANSVFLDDIESKRDFD